MILSSSHCAVGQAIDNFSDSVSLAITTPPVSVQIIVISEENFSVCFTEIMLPDACSVTIAGHV